MYLHPRLLSLAMDVRWRIIISAVVGMLAVSAGVARSGRGGADYRRGGARQRYL